MVAYLIDHTYDATATGHTHIDGHAVLAAFVNGYQVVQLVNAVIYHLGRNYLVLTQEQLAIALQHGDALRQFTIGIGQFVYLSLEIEIA